MLTRMVLSGRSPGYHTNAHASPQPWPQTACYRTSFKRLRCSPLYAVHGAQSSGNLRTRFRAAITLAAQRQLLSPFTRTAQARYTPPTRPPYFTKTRSDQQSPQSVQPSYPWRSLSLRGRRPDQRLNYRPVQTGSDADFPVKQSDETTGGATLPSAAHAPQIPTEELQHNAEELYRVTLERIRGQDSTAPKVTSIYRCWVVIYR